MILLKQSVASQEILIGPFLDDSDGKTAETGLSIANTDIKIWKAGGTSEASKNSGGATHVAGGRYTAVLDATDTDTLGSMEINVHVAGALPVRRECLVVTAAAYDVLTAATGDAFARLGAAGAGLTALPWNAAWDAEVQSECADALAAYDPPTNAEMEARTIAAADYATAANLATVDTVVDAILVDTAEIGAAGAGLTALASAANLATVAGYIDTEIGEIAAAIAAVPTAVENADALLGRTISGGANGGRTVTSALRALRNKTSIAAGTFTVCQEDDSTPAWTATVATAAGDPITSIDPT